ncbi:MAG: nicotinamide-nucleotide amidohydrolase family protein [Dehalococcoidia bacterium]|jgi:PncC family amidohydrolase
MPTLQDEIAQLLRKYQAKTGKLLTIGTVESATGGRISDKITNVPGSSDYYKGSIVSYSNKAKTDIVGVKKQTLKKHGAVSRQTAIEMAKGGRKLLKVDICISDTGIAGPTGATPGKQVGLFYLGLSAKDSSLAKEHHFHGNREENKQKAAEMALTLLIDSLQKHVTEVADSTLDEKHVVTCFLEHGRKILILRRSSKVGTYRRSWAGVSGYIETNDIDQAFTEIRQETQLYQKDLKLIKKGKPLEVIDKNLNRKWIVHPFLFHVKAPDKIKIDWEHTESQWIKPSELKKYETVPGLAKALARVNK